MTIGDVTMIIAILIAPLIVDLRIPLLRKLTVATAYT